MPRMVSFDIDCNFVIKEKQYRNSRPSYYATIKWWESLSKPINKIEKLNIIENKKLIEERRIELLLKLDIQYPDIIEDKFGFQYKQLNEEIEEIKEYELDSKNRLISIFY